MDIETLALDEWKELLPESAAGPFHRPEMLALMDEYATGDLRLLGGFRGQEAVGLLPVFERTVSPLRIVVSPPPDFGVSWLGPILMQSSPKQRKRQQVNATFTEEALEALDISGFRTVFGLVTRPRYTDPRPYLWSGLNTTPRFNMVTDLGDRDEDEVLNSFTSDLRKEIREGDDLDISIEREGPAAAARVCDELRARFTEQGQRFSTPRSFARELIEAFDSAARVYVARDPSGEFLSGMTVLYGAGDAIFWQGGTKANYDGVSVNSLLHWEVITDILADPELEDVERYHLGNALNRRIARYKSKFDASPTVNYEVKTHSAVVARKAQKARDHLTVKSVADRVLNR